MLSGAKYRKNGLQCRTGNMVEGARDCDLFKCSFSIEFFKKKIFYRILKAPDLEI